MSSRAKTIDFDITHHPLYKAEYEKLLQLRNQIDEISAVISRLLNQVTDEARKKAQARRVEDIIAGREPEAPSQREKVQNNLDEARAHRRDLRAAEAEQLRRLSAAELEASKVICEVAEPEYAEIIRGMDQALVELAQWALKEIDFRQALNDGGVKYSYSFTSMNLPSWGDPRDVSSRFAARFVESVERGYMKPSEIPKEIRAEWEKRSGFRFKGEHKWAA